MSRKDELEYELEYLAQLITGYWSEGECVIPRETAEAIARLIQDEGFTR